MSPYIPLLGIMALAAGFLAISITLSSFLGPARYNKVKYSSYECGIEPTPQPVGGGRFPIKYYITAMLFIIFDIETISGVSQRPRLWEGYGENQNASLRGMVP